MVLLYAAGNWVPATQLLLSSLAVGHTMSCKLGLGTKADAHASQLPGCSVFGVLPLSILACMAASHLCRSACLCTTSSVRADKPDVLWMAEAWTSVQPHNLLAHAVQMSIAGHMHKGHTADSQLCCQLLEQAIPRTATWGPKS